MGIMTDNRLSKVKAEIERLYNQSLADENRQADRGLELAANVSYGKSIVCKELLSFIDSLPKEPLSEDLEEVIDKYLDNGMALRLDWKQCDITFKASRLIKFANYIAQWQKEQMLKNAIERKVQVDGGGYPYIDATIELYDYEDYVLVRPHAELAELAECVSAFSHVGKDESSYVYAKDKIMPLARRLAAKEIEESDYKKMAAMFTDKEQSAFFAAIDYVVKFLKDEE